MAVEGEEEAGVMWTLPEDCVANALSLTTPKDACRLSAVAPLFRAAAESDAVWERFLPSDYRHIISRCVEGSDSLLARFKSKKDFYLYLCDYPIFIDAGLKSFSLEKGSGKKIFMLSCRDMFIVWTCTPAYWQWTTHPMSRFAEVAELLTVCWLEIRGKIKINLLSPNTNYAAYLVYKCKSIYGFGDIYTVDGCVGLNGQEGQKHKICMNPNVSRKKRSSKAESFYDRLANIQTNNNPRRKLVEEEVEVKEEEEETSVRYPKKRRDGWLEVELGEHFVEDREEGDLEMSLTDFDSGAWKGGIVVEGIEIRPKHKRSGTTK